MPVTATKEKVFKTAKSTETTRVARTSKDGKVDEYPGINLE